MSCCFFVNLKIVEWISDFQLPISLFSTIEITHKIKLVYLKQVYADKMHESRAIEYFLNI